MSGPETFTLKGYYTSENTGNNSFNYRPLGENIDMAFKKSPQWWNDFTTGFNNAYNSSATPTSQNVQASLAAARALCRQRPFPAGHAGIRQRAQQDHPYQQLGYGGRTDEAAVGVRAPRGPVRFLPPDPLCPVLAGANYRNYIVTPDGNNYVNPKAYADSKQADSKFDYYTYGAFIQLTKKLFEEKLRLTASLRADKTEYFSTKFNPRVAAVYSPTAQHNFRASFQNGYRFPTLFEGFAYVNNGGVRRLGGLPVIAAHTQAFENSYINSSVTAFKNAVNADLNSGSGITQGRRYRRRPGSWCRVPTTIFNPSISIPSRRVIRAFC
ncbi:TonB-dependent receptor domain-containing protein [Puia sp. P3]|uniref:TonB-dependent receptor domain-containing protein n=1 Tax=Puia sp. P3 TaxID=3423952 RepID=UPI003D67C97E